MTEPYKLDLESLAELLPFLEQHGLTGYVHFGAETYAPGKAFAVVFVRKGQEDQYPTLQAAISRAAG